MRAANATVIALFNSGKPFLRADLYTFTLDDGSILRYAEWDNDIVVSGNTYSHSGPIFKRDKVSHKRGILIDEMTLLVTAKTTDLINGNQWMISAGAGALDGADFSLDMAIFDPDVSLTTQVGEVNWFGGKVSDIPELSRMGCEIIIRSDLEKMDVQIPRNFYQPACIRTLYDSGCTANKLGYTQPTILASVTSKSIIQTMYSGMPDGWFDQGTIQITSGSNTGVKRTIKRWKSNGEIELFTPFRFLPVAGNTCKIVPGCDKTKTTCTNKFNNVVNFLGFPYIPLPDSVI